MLKVEAWEADLREVDAALARVPDDAPASLAPVVRAALGGGGKRVRPRVAVLAYRALGGTRTARAVEAAVAVELLHCGTLLVDDVVDASPARRGAPAPWTVHGTPRALLAAGWLVARAGRFGAPSARDTEGVDASESGVALEAFEDVVRAEARALDGAPSTVDAWSDVARGKTGALFALAAEGGARKAVAEAGGGGPVRRVGAASAMRQYGTYLGLAFQARDDVLDHTGNAARLGKPVRADAARGAPNLVAVCAGDVEAAMRVALGFATHAVDALERGVPPSPARDALAGLVDDAVTRDG